MKLDMQVGLGPGNSVLDATQLDPTPPKGQRPHQFSAHICCGQMAAWIKMPLDMQVGLSPGDFVLDGNPAPPPKKGGGDPQIFGPCLLWPNGWMDQHDTWHTGRPQPRRLCARWGPSSSPKSGRSLLPNFWPMSIVAKRLVGSRWHLAWRWALVQATLC